MKIDFKKDKTSSDRSCYQCEGKGYMEIRDCAGEIQRTETCSYCEGGVAPLRYDLIIVRYEMPKLPIN